MLTNFNTALARVQVAEDCYTILRQEASMLADIWVDAKVNADGNLQHTATITTGDLTHSDFWAIDQGLRSAWGTENVHFDETASTVTWTCTVIHNVYHNA